MSEELSRRFLILKNQTEDLSKAADALKAAPGMMESRAVNQSMIGVIRAMQQQIGSFKR